MTLAYPLVEMAIASSDVARREQIESQLPPAQIKRSDDVLARIDQTVMNICAADGV